MADQVTLISTPRLQEETAVQRISRPRRKIDWIAYLFILPAFALIITFHIIPAGYAIWISMQYGAVRNFRPACGDVDAVAKIPEWLGIARTTLSCFDNYNRALTSPEFWDSLKVTLFYVLGTVPFTMTLGLVVAYLLFQKIRGRGIYRTLYFMPHVISTVASAIVWAWVFDPRNGIANQLFGLLGFPKQQWLLESDGLFNLLGRFFHYDVPTWAAGPSLALVSVMIFAVWQALGFNVIIFLAGLTNINPELNEAARIDGANGWQVFRHITIPLLAPTIFFLSVVSVIASFQAFNQIYAMNRVVAQPLGGPLGATRTVTVFMFSVLYGQNRPGYATSIAVLISIFILVFTLIQFRFAGQRADTA
ncbi:MAG TPA: sugar ABC transporter permease [Anaerolineae bacterium]